MSLRTRLIIAFVLLSVVPLTAVTMFWYASSVRAFERAAQHEASQTAVDISRRMELITTDVGRRMDRLFETTPMPPGEIPAADNVRAQLAPMLGETAALVERFEFLPMNPPAAAAPVPAPLPTPGVPAPPHPPAPRPSAANGHPVIVVDVPAMIAEAKRAARAKGAAARVNPAVGKAIEDATGPAVEAAMAAEASSWAHEVAAATAEARNKLAMQVEGRRIEVAIRKDGRVVGKANAMLNLDRTLHTVLALARRDQGEIPFAIDHRGTLYTDAGQRATLERLGVTSTASAAAGGAARRVGDWIVVSRKDAAGFVFGIARPIAEPLREIRQMSLRNLSMGLLVIALAVVGIVPISHRMTEHVSSLSAGVRQLSGGDFKARVAVRSNDEFGALAAAFNKMAEDLERHQALVVEQERLHRELELSRLIQTEMLPRASLRLGAAEIKGISIPAREVGGDFFNYFALPDGRLALLVGDVSGKGVSAALLMANVQATLRARLPLETELAKLAAELDVEIDANTPRGVYVALFIGIADLQRGVLRYVNAGHNPQFLLHAAGGIQALSSTGMPIALYAGQGYLDAEVPIAPGDLLFFYTDGLVEAENEQGEMFGTERLQALLGAQHTERIDTVLETVEAAARAFRGKAEPFDDATLMALRISG